MSKTVNIDVHHVTRVEGHGNIVVNAKDGSIERIEWQVPEAPRFFEAMVRGRSWQDIQTIVSRICGICSVTHSLAAIKAIEDAMGLKVTEKVNRLRILSHYGEQLESHGLHIGYLVVPDLLGLTSALPIASSNPDLLQAVIAVHRAGNRTMELLTGRRTHPVSLRPGGLCKFPGEAELREIRTMYKDCIPMMQKLADAVVALADKIPNFDRDTEYVALVKPEEYTFYHGNIGSTDQKKPVAVRDFESVANEYVSPQSTAKWAKWHRESYAVGALARFNLNSEYLLPLAKKVAGQVGLEKGCCNPYMNTVAQLVECVQVVEHGLQLIDELLTEGVKPEWPDAKPRAGIGVGAIEAPRGILFHKYEFDEKGICLGANCCIPTNQNHANIQKDMEELVPQILDEGEDAIRLKLEMLVRAYDPCISCSTHCLNIEFV